MIDFVELIRVMQLYNARSFPCDASSEDGFAPCDGDQTCCPHESDFLDTPDFSLSLGELLRMVQFFSVGGYTHCPSGGTEDGFCPGT